MGGALALVGCADEVLPCTESTGIAGEESRWEYRPSSGALDTSTVAEVDSMDEDGDGRLSWVTTTTTSAYLMVTRVDQEIVCGEEGLWLERSATQYDLNYEDGRYETGWTEVAYSEPLLVVPATLEVGDSWSNDLTVETRDIEGRVVESSYYTREVVRDADRISVGAGDYDAVEIFTTYEHSNTLPDASHWRAAGVGLILEDLQSTGGLELLEHTP